MAVALPVFLIAHILVYFGCRFIITLVNIPRKRAYIKDPEKHFYYEKLFDREKDLLPPSDNSLSDDLFVNVPFSTVNQGNNEEEEELIFNEKKERESYSHLLRYFYLFLAVIVIMVFFFMLAIIIWYGHGGIYSDFSNKIQVLQETDS